MTNSFARQEETVQEPYVDDVVRNVRVEDKMKLRELELQTQYELKYLSDNFKELRRYVETQSKSESDKFEELKKRVSLLTYIILAQLAGLDAQSLIAMLKSIPM